MNTNDEDERTTQKILLAYLIVGSGLALLSALVALAPAIIETDLHTVKTKHIRKRIKMAKAIAINAADGAMDMVGGIGDGIYDGMENVGKSMANLVKKKKKP